MAKRQKTICSVQTWNNVIMGEIYEYLAISFRVSNPTDKDEIVFPSGSSTLFSVVWQANYKNAKISFGPTHWYAPKIDQMKLDATAIKLLSKLEKQYDDIFESPYLALDILKATIVEYDRNSDSWIKTPDQVLPLSPKEIAEIQKGK